METTLQELTGVWRRESLSVAEGEPYEDSTVYWLQAGAFFADMRWPLQVNGGESSGTSAFSGLTHWAAPTIKFVHELDLTKEHMEDQTILSIENGKLHESGQVTINDELIQFQEVWTPVELNQTELKINVARREELIDQHRITTAYLVRVGNFSIVMQENCHEFTAGCWQALEKGERWSKLYSIGDITYLEGVLNDITNGGSHPDWRNLL
mgnify:CR=1 FL=1